MNPLLDDVKAAAFALPPADRAELAELLWESLPFDEDAWNAVWSAELDRRLDDLKSGRDQGVSGEEVMANLQKEFP